MTAAVRDLKTEQLSSKFTLTITTKVSPIVAPVIEETFVVIERVNFQFGLLTSHLYRRG